MSRNPIRNKDIEDPGRIFNNLLKDYVAGNLDSTRVLYRATVIKIDTVGGALSGPGTNNTELPANPKGSVQARVITNALDTYTDDDNLTVFWPLFPYDLMPVKEGEDVYVIFEDPDNKEFGLWITRIPEPNDVHSFNLTPGVKKYEENEDKEFSDVGAQSTVQDTAEDPGTPEVSEEFTTEDVPSFRPRVGDRVIHGSNNTSITFSRDRISSPDTGETDQAGTLDLVAGRSAEEDVDFEADTSRLYITMNSDIDGNFNIQVGPSAGPSAGVVVKSDEIRVVARNGMKLVVEGGDIFIEGENIHLGPDDGGESAVLGDTLKSLMDDLVEALQNLQVFTPAGPSSLLNAHPTWGRVQAVKAKFNQYLSQTIKLKS